jgi:uncharacterized protein YbjT (DUF2867 family)
MNTFTPKRYPPGSSVPLRRDGESIKAYRVRVGWDAPSVAHDITFRGVDLRVEMNSDNTIKAVEVGGVDVRPLLSELLMDDLYAAVRDGDADALRRAEKLAEARLGMA